MDSCSLCDEEIDISKASSQSFRSVASSLPLPATSSFVFVFVYKPLTFYIKPGPYKPPLLHQRPHALRLRITPSPPHLHRTPQQANRRDRAHPRAHIDDAAGNTRAFIRIGTIQGSRSLAFCRAAAEERDRHAGQSVRYESSARGWGEWTGNGNGDGRKGIEVAAGITWGAWEVQ